MKKPFHKITLLIMFSFSHFAYSQNLVPNPSFEDTVYCPWGTGQIDAALNWKNFGNSPDYFNACAPLGINVPYAFTGFQYAHTGVAMAGVATYVWQFDPAWPNYREYVGAQLLTPLNVGQKYFISFFINFAGYLQGWQKIGADKIGIKYSTIPFSEFSPPSLNNFAHLYTDSIYVDTVQWVKISGSFIADSAYNYLILGNFFDSAQTDTVIFGGPPFGGSASYYYLDDVCVTTDSLYNEKWTGLNKQDINNNSITIFPNPTSDILNMNGINNINEIQIINNLGEIVYKTETHGENNLVLSLLGIQSGIYFIRIKTKENYYFEQFSIIH